MSQRASLLGYTLQAHAFSCVAATSFPRMGWGRPVTLLLLQLLRLSLERPFLSTHLQVSPFPRQRRQQELSYWKAEKLPSGLHQALELSGPSNSVCQLKANWRLLPAFLCDGDWL